MLPPADKIRVIEQSLRCFVFGVLSLVPLLGLPFAVLAVGLHLKVWTEVQREWNPAKLYLLWGYGLAWLGGLISLGALAIFVFALMKLYDF
jgi:hypothetical protein